MNRLLLISFGIYACNYIGRYNGAVRKPIEGKKADLMNVLFV